MKNILLPVLLLVCVMNTGCDKNELTPPTPEQKNTAPKVFAGDPIYLVHPTSSWMLTGRVEDGENNVSSFLWKQLKGPTTLDIARPDSLETMISNLEPGDYELELTVTDKGLLSASSKLEIYVLVPGTNSITFPSMTWGCPMGCTVLIRDFYSYVPRSANIKVFISLNGSQQWVPVKHESQWTAGDEYVYLISAENTFMVYANDAQGTVQIKVEY